MEKLNLKAALAQVDAEKDICGEYNGPIKRILRALCGEKEEETYGLGDKFVRDGDDYVLTAPTNTEAMLVKVSTGWRYYHPQKICDWRRITKTEFVAICGGSSLGFTRKDKSDE